jgi:hypothetical protein
MMVEAHRFGIDGDRVAVAADVGQVAAMDANRHDLPPESSASFRDPIAHCIASMVTSD